MGVTGLWGILEPVKVHHRLESLQGQTLAVDLSIWICEAQVKQMQGVVVKPHLRTLFFRVLNLLNLGIKLVFVIEGKAPELKHQTIVKRQNARFGGKAKTSIKPPKRSHFMALIRECCELLNYLGVPYVNSVGEAEAMCAYLNKEGFVDACVTDDGDAFLYGATTVYRNFTLNSKDPHIESYSIKDINDKLNLSREKLVAIALFVGCDFIPKGVPGIGPTQAIKLIKNMDGDILQWLRSWKNESASKIPLHNRELEKLANNIQRKALLVTGFPNNEVISEFLSPKDRCTRLDSRWKRPDMIRICELCIKKLEWEGEYAIEKSLPLVTLWDMLNRNTAGLKPIRIVKTRVRHRIPCFEIEWEKLTEDNFTEADVYVTVEERSLFEKAFPSCVQLFDQCNDRAAKTKKKKVNRKQEECEDNSQNLPSYSQQYENEGVSGPSSQLTEEQFEGCLRSQTGEDYMIDKFITSSPRDVLRPISINPIAKSRVKQATVGQSCKDLKQKDITKTSALHKQEIRSDRLHGKPSKTDKPLSMVDLLNLCLADSDSESVCASPQHGEVHYSEPDALEDSIVLSYIPLHERIKVLQREAGMKPKSPINFLRTKSPLALNTSQRGLFVRLNSVEKKSNTKSVWAKTGSGLKAIEDHHISKKSDDVEDLTQKIEDLKFSDSDNDVSFNSDMMPLMASDARFNSASIDMKHTLDFGELSPEKCSVISQGRVENYSKSQQDDVINDPELNEDVDTLEIFNGRHGNNNISHEVIDLISPEVSFTECEELLVQKNETKGVVNGFKNSVNLLDALFNSPGFNKSCVNTARSPKPTENIIFDLTDAFDEIKIDDSFDGNVERCRNIDDSLEFLISQVVPVAASQKNVKKKKLCKIKHDRKLDNEGRNDIIQECRASFVKSVAEISIRNEWDSELLKNEEDVSKYSRNNVKQMFNQVQHLSDSITSFNDMCSDVQLNVPSYRSTESLIVEEGKTTSNISEAGTELCNNSLPLFNDSLDETSKLLEFEGTQSSCENSNMLCGQNRGLNSIHISSGKSDRECDDSCDSDRSCSDSDTSDVTDETFDCEMLKLSFLKDKFSHVETGGSDINSSTNCEMTQNNPSNYDSAEVGNFSIECSLLNLTKQ